MESLAIILTITFATGCLFLAIWHEIRWRSRINNWNQSKGKVVAIIREREVSTLFGGKAMSDDGPWAEIEYNLNGSSQKFISDYGGSGTPKVGSEVDLIIDPATGKAEQLNFTNRWLFTIIPLIFSIAFYWFSTIP